MQFTFGEKRWNGGGEKEVGISNLAVEERKVKETITK